MRNADRGMGRPSRKSGRWLATVRGFGLLMIAAGCTPAQESPGPADAASRLVVQGNQIICDGSPLLLRGLAVGDPVIGRADRTVSDYVIIRHDWNANIVRLSVHPSNWKHMDHEQVLSRVERDVDAALGTGMFVIIDWHSIGWPDGAYEQVPAEWGDPPDLYDSDFALAESFWEATAARFGDDGRIVFELWCEPLHPGDESSDAPGQRVSRWAELKPYWEQLLKIVRARSDNLVLAASNYWAYNLAGIRDDLLADDNTAYAWHIYAGTDDDHPANWAVALDDLDRVRPVVVTEWGFDTNFGALHYGTADSFGRMFADQFLSGRSLGFTAWCWHADWTPALLQSDWTTPTPYGAFVFELLH